MYQPIQLKTKIPLVVLFCALTSYAFAANNAGAHDPNAVPAGLAASDWAGIRAAHEAQRYAVTSNQGSYSAHNPTQQWQTQFDGRGFLTRPEKGDWQWGVELRRYGFAGSERSVERSANIQAQDGRVSYERGEDVREWFVNDQRGLEHGFTILKRLPGSGQKGAPLQLTFSVRGNLSPEISNNGNDIRFNDKNGAAVVTYAKLEVWDADGKKIPARFIANKEGFALSVDERAAHYPLTIDPVAQQAYLKASNTDGGDGFGWSVAISGDTVEVGAYREDSNATGINGNQADNSATDSGAAYVFVRNGATWTQQAYLKASNTDAGDRFGVSVAISGDTAVVGADGERSNATGINGDQTDNSLVAAGAAYVFVRTGQTWTQQAYLKASNTDSNDQFGHSVAISGDTVVVSAANEDSNATGINGDQTNNSATNAGAAYVFVRAGQTWTQQAYLKASNTDSADYFGDSVAISGDTVVVGAFGEASNATGINGDQTNNSAFDSGAAYVFVRSGTTWTQQAYLKASNTDSTDEFGGSVAISGDTVVVGASTEDSNATGINGDQTNNSASQAGAAYVFVRTGTTWTQQAYLKASNTNSGDAFGWSVAISGDTVVVGARFESSNATGINGDQTNNSASQAGAAYAFVRTGQTWTQQAYLKASNTDSGDFFGQSVAISGDTVVVGAYLEASNATGINGDQTNNSASDSGATYTFVLGLPYDFNQDNHPDLVLYNASTRQTALWYLNNSTFLGGSYGPTLPSGWNIVDVADFNGDGKPDYVLFNQSTRQSAIWYLSGPTLLSGVFGPTAPAGWQLAAVGDFNNDNKPDYVLYNATTRQTAIWYLNNNAFVAGAYGPTLPANWRIVAVADFNSDNKPDYLLFNTSTRQSAIWYLSGTTYVTGQYGPSIISGYSLAGATDFNRDGQPDYVLYNASTRQTAIGYLRNNFFSAGAFCPTPPSGWSLAAP